MSSDGQAGLKPFVHDCVRRPFRKAVRDTRFHFRTLDLERQAVVSLLRIVL